MARPLKYNEIEFKDKIEKYLLDCGEKGKMPTKGGLAMYLEMTRDMLGDYEKKEGFGNALKRAYYLIEDEWVQRLKGQSVAGIIFYLKNAFSKDWRDKQEIEVKDLTDELSKED